MSAKPTALGGSKPLLAGGAVGIPLAVGHRIGGIYDFVSTAAGAVAAPTTGFAHVYLWGPGGGGGPAGGSNSGGGGGAAAYKRIPISVGQLLGYVVSAGAVGQADAADSTVTAPDGQVLRAGGGKGGQAFVAGSGGVANGGDLNRAGGGGGVGGTVGTAGTDGAAGGGNAAGNAGGGGAGGFADLPSTLTGGVGGNGAANGLPSGGGGGTASSGGDGRLLIIFEQTAA